MVTIQDLENSLDEIVTLYTLIKPEELSFSYSEANYYNSSFYKSPLYKFIKNLSIKQREIINTSIIIGYWLYSSPEEIKYSSKKILRYLYTLKSHIILAHHFSTLIISRHWGFKSSK